MHFYIDSVEETQALASKMAPWLKPGMVILLDGPLGSGKTTFTQKVGKELGVKRAIKSPTYTIVKEYPLPNFKLIHIDAYRLEEGGADSIDFDSYLNEPSIIFIEWSEYLYDYLPLNRLRIKFVPQTDPNQREIILMLEGESTEQYQELLEKMEEI